MLSAFQLFYIPQDMCELVCALSIQPVRAVHLRTHQSVPSGGSSFLYTIFHCALGPKWRVTFHCRGRRRKASVGPSRGSGQRSDSWNFCSLPGCRRRVHHAATLAVKWGPGLIKLHTRSSKSGRWRMRGRRGFNWRSFSALPKGEESPFCPVWHTRRSRPCSWLLSLQLLFNKFQRLFNLWFCEEGGSSDFLSIQISPSS
jgi:hypothetical protein